jgi:hypothetical protein
MIKIVSFETMVQNKVYLFQDVSRGLTELLAYEGNVEEDMCMNFQVSIYISTLLKFNIDTIITFKPFVKDYNLRNIQNCVKENENVQLQQNFRL